LRSPLPQIREFIILICIFASVAALPAFAEKPMSGGTLIVGSMGEPIQLDPGVIMDSESAQVAYNMFETLVEYDPVNNKYIPVLATSWTISPDMKTYTFHLRKNVKFHDGNPFNAGTVKFSWERQYHGGHPFHNPPYGRFIFYRALWGGYPGNIREIKIIDNYTVRVKLYSRSFRFLKNISALQFAIVSPRAVYKHQNDFGYNPVGTGPFKFVEWRKWQRIVLEANREYWRGRPHLDRLVFEPAPGEKSRRRHLERHRIDIMEDPTTDFLYNIKVKGRYPGLKIYTYPGTNFSLVSINCQKRPLNDPLVRRALNYAIDRRRILRDINEDMPVVPSPFVELWGKRIAGKTYPLNHDMARSLFARAGYPRGFEVELWYPKISRPFLISPRRIARGVKQSLEEVGLRVRLKGMKWETYLEKLRFGKHDLAITGFVGMDFDPDIYFGICWDRNNAILGGTNNSFFRNDRIDSILTSCRFEPRRSVRAEKYKIIQEIIADDCPIIPLYHNRTVAVMGQNVRGFSSNKKGLINFHRIWLQR